VSRNYYNGDSSEIQQQEHIRHISSRSGLGLSELDRAEEMRIVRTAFVLGTFGRFGSIEKWIEEVIHPAYQEDALRLVARLKNN